MSNESYKTMPRLFQVYVSEICLMSNERYKTMPQLFQVLMSEIRLVSNGKYSHAQAFSGARVRDMFDE